METKMTRQESRELEKKIKDTEAILLELKNKQHNRVLEDWRNTSDYVGFKDKDGVELFLSSRANDWYSTKKRINTNDKEYALILNLESLSEEINFGATLEDMKQIHEYIGEKINFLEGNDDEGEEF